MSDKNQKSNAGPQSPSQTNPKDSNSYIQESASKPAPGCPGPSSHEIVAAICNSWKKKSAGEPSTLDYKSQAFCDLFLHADFTLDVRGDELNSPSGLKVGFGKQCWDLWLKESERFQWIDYDFVVLHINAEVVVVKQAYRLMNKANGKMTGEQVLGDYIEWQFKDQKIKAIKIYFGYPDVKTAILRDDDSDGSE
jgi:hypothetical protein